MELKESLKRARKYKGYTQKKLSEEFDTHIQTIRNWEQGICAPSLQTLIDLSDFYNCSLDYLVGKIDCHTHDDEFISQETGFPESTILKIKSLSKVQTATLSHIIEHKNLAAIIRIINELSDHESLNQNLAMIIIDNISRKLDRYGGKKDVPKPVNVPSSLLEDALIYKLNTTFTEVVRDITDTPVSE